MKSINEQVAEWLNSLEKHELIAIINELCASRSADNNLLEIWERSTK